MRTDTGSKIRLADYAPSPYAAPSVSLMFALHPTATIVKNTTQYAPRHEGAGPLILEGDALTLVSAELSGLPLEATDYEVSADRFVLHNPPEKPFELTLTTRLSPDENTQLMGLYRSNGVYCTQCEAEGFRRITYAYDRPDVLSVYDVSILADGPGSTVLLSNGNPGITGETDGRRYAMWHDPHPKPSYLFALVAGDLGVVRDVFTTASGTDVELAIYVERGKEERTSYAMEALKRSMRWDEERFGREYDLSVFNIVAVSDFNMGAMENKGLNVFNDRYVLADPALATDTDYANIDAIIAHEYFHNWTGNRITCRDWFQLCLKEGLTVFRDQEYTSDTRERGVKRIEDVKRLRAAQFREDGSPLRHPVRPSHYAEISNLYTATVYEKGAELIRMLEVFLGRTRFDAGMTTYFERHDGDAATVEDFLACFDGVPDGFMGWYLEPGTPVLAAREDIVDGRYTLSLKQRPPDGASLKPLPVRLALFGHDGAEIDLSGLTVEGGELSGDCLTMVETASLSMPAVFTPAASILRGFSAPLIVERADHPERDAAILAAESDALSAWDAAQRLMLAQLKAAYHTGTPSVADLAEPLAQAAANTNHPPALRGLLLQLPARSTVIEAIGANVDPQKIINAHTALSGALGTAMATTLAKIRNGPAPNADDIGPKAAAVRSLRNSALGLLVSAGDHDLGLAEARTSQNMTDKIAALSALSAAGCPDVDDALQQFHDSFQDEPLVLDKYFSLQALREDGDPLARVKELMAHPRFSLSNPNRTRSLIGAFAQNLSAFNAADGSGYGFVAGIAEELDSKNPQVAARLLTAFGTVTRMETIRRSAAKGVLSALLEQKRSSDVADIVRRLVSSWPE